MKSPWREVIVALLVGVIVGWFAATRSFEVCAHHWKSGGGMLEKFSKELKLSPEQKEKVGTILESKRAQFAALRTEMKPRFEEIRTSSKSEIAKVLTPEQMERFTQMEERWKARREKNRERWAA